MWSAARLRAAFAGLLLGLSIIPAMPGAHAAEDVWPVIRSDVFGQRAIAEAKGSLLLFAPAQAADASLVPLSIRLPASSATKAKSITLIVDRNPSPIAAVIEFGDAYRQDVKGERLIATRIRVDSFSQVRAILEDTDGTLHMASQFVAGAGGCSALPSKDMTEAIASLGRVKVVSRASPEHDASWREGVAMIRHPNFTGMQMNPQTGNYTPLRYVDRIEINSGSTLLMQITGGISISEDPNFRFTYAAHPGGEPLTLKGRDSEGTTFSGSELPSGS